MKTIVQFNVVHYTKYKTPVTNFRGVVPTRNKNGNIVNMAFEASSIRKLFELLYKMYPGIDFDIPDEIDTIFY